MPALDQWTRYTPPQQPRHVSQLLGPLRRVVGSRGRVVSLAEAKAQARVDIGAEDTLIEALIDAATAYCEQEVSGHRQFLTATYDVPVENWWCGPLTLPRPPLQAVTSVSYYDTTGTVQTLASTYYTVETPWRQPGTIERAPNQTLPDLQCDRRHPVTIRFIAGYLAPVTANATTDTLTSTGQAFSDGDKVRMWNAGGTLPAGLSLDTDYYVVSASGQSFSLATYPGGSAIDITGTGTGAHSCGLIPQTIRQAILLLVGHWFANREAFSAQSVDKAIGASIDALLMSESWGSYR